MYKHILIPTDGSKLGQKAVEHGVALAKTLGAKVTGLTVRPSYDMMNAYFTLEGAPARLPEEMERFEKDTAEMAAKVLASIKSAAAAAGVACTTVQVESPRPFEAIIETAKSSGCDLICMASHGRSGASALFLGSETTKVLTHSTIPVLVYR